MKFSARERVVQSGDIGLISLAMRLAAMEGKDACIRLMNIKGWRGVRREKLEFGEDWSDVVPSICMEQWNEVFVAYVVSENRWHTTVFTLGNNVVRLVKVYNMDTLDGATIEFPGRKREKAILSELIKKVWKLTKARPKTFS